MLSQTTLPTNSSNPEDPYFSTYHRNVSAWPSLVIALLRSSDLLTDPWPPPFPLTAALENYDGSITNSSLNGWLAQQNRGAAVVLEHRFFGQSNPYKNLSEEAYSVLTVEQAMADIVYFAQNVKLPMPGGSKAGPDKLPWVLVGGTSHRRAVLGTRLRLCLRFDLHSSHITIGLRLLSRCSRSMDYVSVRHSEAHHLHPPCD